MERDRKVKQRTRRSKYDDCFEKLPQEFTLEDFRDAYGLDGDAARMQVTRLKKRGFIEAPNRGKYKKLVNRII